MSFVSAIASRSRSAEALPRERDHRAAREVAVVIGSVLFAFALTKLFGPLISRAVFVFLYGAVAASAAYGGVRAGIGASLLSGALVAWAVMAPAISQRVVTRDDIGSLAAFIVMSSLLSMLVASLRDARRVAESSAAQLKEQAAEMEAQQEELQALAHQLEDSNTELESAVEEATNARDEAVAGEERVRLLDEASRLLTSSLDYETTVAATARLAVPVFADWCAVDLLVNGHIQQLAIAHVDPKRVEWARQVGNNYPPDPDAPTGVPAVIRTGQPQLIPVVTDDVLRASARDAEHLKILRALGVASVMIVPMSTRGQTLGAMTLIRARAGRPYSPRELGVALDVARRAAAAIDNARHYRAALVANESKANFLATMSHELRTPLAAIIGYEELLSEGITGPVSDLQRQQLGRIKASASHLLALIEEILLFARVEAGRESVRIESLVAKNVVDDAVAFVEPSADEKQITLSIEPFDARLVLETDVSKLRQMLVNLLANAVKFTTRGRVTLRVFADDLNVVFEVEDTGIGISREDLERIFDPFWQVEQHTARKIGGSGLGLSVTRNLASLLGGSVDVSSTLDVGSKFRLTLPRHYGG